MTIFKIDGEEIDVEELGPDAMSHAQRMSELQNNLENLEMQAQEIKVLINTYAMSIKQIANPDPKIEVVK